MQQDFKSITCTSHLEFHKTNNAIDFVKILIKFRILNSKNKKNKITLENILNNPNISEEEIKKYLDKKGLSFHNFREKINDHFYADLPKQESIESIEKTCKKENRNNKRKIEYYKRKNLLLNIDKKRNKRRF
jgi:Zn-dependent metalloprotease